MVNDRIKEVIFVGLPGPTHNYGGLSQDNIASSKHRGQPSNPKEAALQALTLIKMLWGLGIEVGVLPPQRRPYSPLLRQYFSGDDDAIIRQAAREHPALLETAASSSAMWTANAATVAPAIDCTDKKLHLTIANLHTNPHRRIEAADSYRVLQAIFSNVSNVIVHPPLLAEGGHRDEGAANHMRLSPRHDAKGLHAFVYGATGGKDDPPSARQDLKASQAVCAQHQIPDAQALFLQQHPDAIRQGVFHNDVIAVSNESLLLVHEKAYLHGFQDIELIEQHYQNLHPGKTPCVIVCQENSLSVEEAVHTYFFNSQIVTTADASGADGAMAIIAPIEVQMRYDGKGAHLMQRICDDSSNPIEQVHYVDLRQSMQNGGGPACLRLRVPMTQLQLDALKAHSGVMADEALLAGLERIISTHYPNQLHPRDIADPALYHCSVRVLQELSALMRLPL